MLFSSQGRRFFTDGIGRGFGDFENLREGLKIF